MGLIFVLAITNYRGVLNSIEMAIILLFIFTDFLQRFQKILMLLKVGSIMTSATNFPLINLVLKLLLLMLPLLMHLHCVITFNYILKVVSYRHVIENSLVSLLLLTILRGAKVTKFNITSVAKGKVWWIIKHGVLFEIWQLDVIHWESWSRRKNTILLLLWVSLNVGIVSSFSRCKSSASHRNWIRETIRFKYKLWWSLHK